MATEQGLVDPAESFSDSVFVDAQGELIPVRLTLIEHGNNRGRGQGYFLEPSRDNSPDTDAFIRITNPAYEYITPINLEDFTESTIEDLIGPVDWKVRAERANRDGVVFLPEGVEISDPARMEKALGIWVRAPEQIRNRMARGDKAVQHLSLIHI